MSLPDFNLDDDQISAYMLRAGLKVSLSKQCTALFLQPSSTLTFRHLSRTEIKIIYHGRLSDCCGLHISYDPYVCTVRYAMDVGRVFGELWIKVHGAESHLETPEGSSMTATEAAASLLMMLPLPVGSV